MRFIFVIIFFVVVLQVVVYEKDVSSGCFYNDVFFILGLCIY